MTITPQTISGTRTSHARARVLSELTGANQRICRSFLKTLPEEQKTAQLFTDLLTKDRRKTSVKQILQAFSQYDQNHQSPWRKASRPTSPNNHENTTPTTTEHWGNLEQLIAIKQLARQIGGYQAIQQGIQLLQQLEK